MDLNRRSFFNLLARIMSYPDPDLLETTRLAVTFALPLAPQSAEGLEKFLGGVCDLDQGAREELFTSTFDLNPQFCLDLGWHLHGENYDRGAFLVTMRDSLRRHEIPEGSELPDHLSHALRLLGCLDGMEATAFAEGVILPAMDHLFTAFTDTDNPYHAALLAVRNAAQTAVVPDRCEA